MAETVKLLGQLAPSATTETVLYTVPASTTTVISTIVVCNRDSGDATFHMGVSDGGGAMGTADYLYYGLPLPGNETFACTFGITVGAADEIRVWASTGNLTFQAFGTEIT